MTRYIVLEIEENTAHDITDLVETMREWGKGEARLLAAGYDLGVTIPRRWDVQPVKDGVISTGPYFDLYMAQEA